MKANINVVIRTVPHPDPKRAIDVIARLIVNDIIRKEDELKNREDSESARG